MCAACGHLGFDEVPSSDGGTPDAGARDASALDSGPVDSGAGDAGGDDAGASDAGADGGEPLGPFGEAHLIEELSSVGDLDDDPSLTDDLLEIYFRSNRGRRTNDDIWMAARDDAGLPFGAPVRVDALSSDGFDVTPEVAADGLSITLASDREASAATDIFVSTRATRDAPWSAPVRVVDLSSPGEDYAASADAAGQHLLLTRPVEARSLDLFEATRAAPEDPWGGIAASLALSSDAYDADAHLSSDGLRVVFASERAGGAGRRDIWISIRESPAAEWALPTDLLELATASDDEDPWLSADGRTLVFASDRNGDRELWIATR